jgi:hypothetical protein
MIAVENASAIASVDTFAEFLFRNLAALWARLACLSWVNRYKLTTSAFRLVREHFL